jgi:putative glutamine transport system permease protein
MLHHRAFAPFLLGGGIQDSVRSFLSTIHGHEAELAHGFWTTLSISALAFVICIVGGTALAVMRTSGGRLLRWPATTYVELFRNIPLLVIIVFLFFALPKMGLVLSGFKAGVIGLGVYTAAFTSEAFRAGILAVDRGQIEAARASGLSGAQTLRYVVLPQALAIALPPLANVTIAMVKNSALVEPIGVADITLTTDKLADRTAHSFEFLGVAIVLYLLLNLPLAGVARRLERRAARGSG